MTTEAQQAIARPEATAKPTTGTEVRRLTGLTQRFKQAAQHIGNALRSMNIHSTPANTAYETLATQLEELGISADTQLREIHTEEKPEMVAHDTFPTDQDISPNPQQKKTTRERIRNMGRSAELYVRGISLNLSDEGTQKKIHHLLDSQEAHPVTATASLLRTFYDLPTNDQEMTGALALLRENMPKIVSVALNEPRLHRNLLGMIIKEYQYSLMKGEKYKERREYMQELLEEVIQQLGKVSENGASKAIFIDKLTKKLNFWGGTASRGSKFPENLLGDLEYAFERKIGSNFDFLEENGMDIGLFFKHHEENRDDFRHYNNLRSRLSILGLEHLRPGICSRLQSKYRINNFHRYPQEFLLRLDQHAENTHVNQRTLVVASAYDPTTYYLRQYKKLSRLGRNGSEPLLYEVASFGELVELIQQTDNSVLKSIDSMNFIGYHPKNAKEIINLMNNNEDFFALLNPGGILYSNRETVLQNVFDSDDPSLEAKRIQNIFSVRRPYWESLYFFTEQKLGSELRNATSKYSISHIGRIPLETLKNSPRLASIIEDKTIRTQFLKGEISTVPFWSLSPLYKRLVFRDYLRRTVETSQDDIAKQKAHERNIQRVQSTPSGQLQFNDSTRLHGSAIDFIEPMLAHGNLCGEALGADAKQDQHPFHVDLSSPARGSTISQMILQSLSKAYGNTRQFSNSGQLFYLYDREDTNWEKNHETVVNPEGRNDHFLMLGGIPSTEIVGIVMRDATRQTAVINQIVSNGFYIPVYDIDGNLLFTPKAFQEIYEDLNMRVKVTRINFSEQTGDKEGSNEGGTFVIQTEKGPQKAYIKFSNSEDHIWNERLADMFYEQAGAPVPYTDVIKLEGRLGHASEIIPDDAEDIPTARNDFALMDMWLANWDISVAPSRNMKLGRRIDNGGALLFSAQGERKSETVKKGGGRVDFGPECKELLTMPSFYPGLKKEDLRFQAKRLAEQFPDTTIRKLVDSVRLSRVDRDFLFETLRQRRDNIIYQQTHEIYQQTEVTTEGKETLTLLAQPELDDKKIIQLVPKWAELIGESGHQHNGELVGDHIKDVLRRVKEDQLYIQLPENEKHLALLAAFFHDFGKPTGKSDEKVMRDFSHEIFSAQIAGETMAEWGFSTQDIETVQLVILHDGMVSDIVRGKVRNPETPEQLFDRLNRDPRIVSLLRIVNLADASSVTHGRLSDEFLEKYNAFFDDMS